MEMRIFLPILSTAIQKREELATECIENQRVLGRSMEQLVKAVYDASKANSAIRLKDLIDGDKHLKQELFKQLELALGVRDAEGKYTGTLGDLFPRPGERRDAPGYRERDTFRAEFRMLLRRACRTILAAQAKMRSFSDADA